MKNMFLSPQVKIGMICLFMAATLGYSLVEKRKIDELTSQDNFLILKELPEVNLTEFETGRALDNKALLAGRTEALLVHFWGTWCAPCEAELPDFIKFADKFKDKGVKALLLAVQDDDKAIKKYLRRYGRLPDNIVIAHDKNGDLLSVFGTAKVPETYLFNNSGKSLNKFVGPQDWAQSSYTDRMNFYLSLNQSE